MDRTKGNVGRENKRGSRAIAYVLVSLIVLGGAVSAGSALGKKENGGPEGAAAVAGAPVAPTIAPKHTHNVYQIETEEALAGAKLSFEVKDFSFGVENPTTIGSATGGAGAGKIEFNEFTIKKTVDRASPAFFKNCAAGAHYKKITIEMRQVNDKNSSDSTTLLRFTFDTVFTTKIDWSGPGDEGPEESITFVYGKLAVEYFPQDGSDPTAAGWDQVQNKAWNPASE